MSEEETVKVQVLANGPLLITGKIELCDHEGNPFDLGGREKVALCRCGASSNKPLCDGSHAKL